MGQPSALRHWLLGRSHVYPRQHASSREEAHLAERFDNRRQDYKRGLLTAEAICALVVGVQGLNLGNCISFADGFWSTTASTRSETQRRQKRPS